MTESVECKQKAAGERLPDQIQDYTTVLKAVILAFTNKSRGHWPLSLVEVSNYAHPVFDCTLTVSAHLLFSKKLGTCKQCSGSHTENSSPGPWTEAVLLILEYSWRVKGTHQGCEILLKRDSDRPRCFTVGEETAPFERVLMKNIIYYLFFLICGSSLFIYCWMWCVDVEHELLIGEVMPVNVMDCKSWSYCYF